MEHSFTEFGWAGEACGTPHAATVPAPLAADSSLTGQLKPFLGEDCPPDPAFFVESWTLGAAVAAENFRRRHAEPEQHQMPAFSRLNYVPPFVGSAEWLSAATVPLPRHSGSTASIDGLLGEDEYLDLLTGALTVERARRILGVAANSTRGQVKAAYRQLAGRYHPDHHAAQSDDERRLATDCMAAVNEAYRLLCTVQSERLA